MALSDPTARQAAKPDNRAGIRLPAALSKGDQAVEVSTDRASSHRLMHIRTLLRWSRVRNGRKSHNAEENPQGELSEVHLISCTSNFR
jgi:hypothetical protein